MVLKKKYNLKINIQNYSSCNDEWRKTDWTKIEGRLERLQTKIFYARKKGNLPETRKLQKHVLRSYEFKKLAVQKIYQDNRRKKIANNDNILKLSEKKRVSLANDLKITGRSEKLKRIQIGHCKKSFYMGIPSFRDKALQTLFVFALEPEFEAIFDQDSYARPGRSRIDAMKQIFINCKGSEKFVLQIELKHCFNIFDHEKLLDLIGHRGKIRRQIKSWLKSGNVFEGTFEEWQRNTPSGSPLALLFCNIALNGLQTEIEDWVLTQKITRQFGVGMLSGKRKLSSIGFIRYATSLIIMHHQRDIIENCKKIIEKFLLERGLGSIRTKFCHTRFAIDSCKKKAGFDFLGFTIKHFNSWHRSAKNSKGEKIGYKLLIYPSKKSIKEHYSELKKLLKKYKYAEAFNVINRLNILIIKWTNYFKFSYLITTKIANSMNYTLYRRLLHWAKKKLNARTFAPGYKKFWRKVNGRTCFSDIDQNQKRVRLVSYTEIASGMSIQKYRNKVKKNSSIYDGNKSYWSSHVILPERLTKTKRFLINAQKSKCTVCGCDFKPGDLIEVDHMISKSKGGKDSFSNFQLLHAHCHDYKKNFIIEAEMDDE